MRVLLISLGSILVLVMMLATARFWGLGLPHQEFKHPFFEQRAIYTVQVENLGQAADAMKADPAVVLWLDVRISKDRKLFVLSQTTAHSFLKPENMGSDFRGSKTYMYDWAQIKTYFTEAKPLTDFVSQFPQQRFIVNVIDNHDQIHELLTKELSECSPEKRILVQSETDVILKSVKDKEPFWIFGTSLPELTRLVTFSSIGLQPAISVRGDVMISPLRLHERTFINEEVLIEMKRRLKKVLLGPIKNDAELNQAVSLFQKSLVDGFIVENPKQIKLISAQIGAIK